MPNGQGCTLGNECVPLLDVTSRSLRDAKRAATSAGLAFAALRLAEERGLDGFTIDDVVTEAGYSRRTFANHFAGKEDAVVAAPFLGFEDLDRLAAQLPERLHLSLLVLAVEEWPHPVAEQAGAAVVPDVALSPGDVVDALERIVLSPIIVGTLRATERIAPLVDANPTLLPALLSRQNAWTETINRLIARIDGIDSVAPFLPILLGALSGALSSSAQFLGTPRALRASREPKSVADYRDRIRLTFDYLRHGFVR